LECWTPAVFVCLRLADPEMDLQGRALRLFERSPREMWHALREHARQRGARSLEREALAGVLERGQVATERVLSCLDAQPARADEIQWLVRQAFCRGLGEPTIAGLDAPQALSYPDDAYPRIVPEEGNVLRWLGENGVECHHRYVKVLSELGESFQAGVCVGEMGHTWPFSRSAEVMFSPVEEHGPVDVALNARWISNDKRSGASHTSSPGPRTSLRMRSSPRTAHWMRATGGRSSPARRTTGSRRPASRCCSEPCR